MKIMKLSERILLSIISQMPAYQPVKGGWSGEIDGIKITPAPQSVALATSPKGAQWKRERVGRLA